MIHLVNKFFLYVPVFLTLYVVNIKHSILTSSPKF